VQPHEILGRRDKADFPDLGLFDIDVKIDTGAYTSSIHCQNIEIIQSTSGQHVRFNLLDPTHSAYDTKEFVLPLHQMKDVKSSSGEQENRVFIQTHIMLFGKLHSLELSLTNRSDMKYPVLLGRKLLKQGRFRVNVRYINRSYKLKMKSLQKGK
jgi:hypothetical protein